MLPGSVLDLFSRQYSLVARHQLRTVCTPAERRRVVGHPEVARHGPRVLRHRAGAPSLGQQLLLPVLDAGADALLWGYAATQWWGFGRFRAFPVDVARRPVTLRGGHIGRIHCTSVIDHQLDATEHRGIPIVRPERLLLWLARVETCRYGHELGALRLERTLDHAWREGLVGGRRIHELAERASGRGNAGIVILRQLLEARPPDYQPTESHLERRWEEVVGSLSEQFRRQVVLGDDAPIGRFDEIHRERPLVVEIHSEKFHTLPSDVARDAERTQRLIDAGFAVVVYWEYDIWHDGPRVRDSLRQILAAPHEPRLHRPTPAPYLPIDPHPTGSDPTI